MSHNKTGLDHFFKYSSSISEILQKTDFEKVFFLAEGLFDAWQQNRQVLICGNGGSAANAMHIANDFLYGIAKDSGRGIRVHALPANQPVLTCLANDISYADVFSQQVRVFGQPGDILIVLSGSGNSMNVVKAIEAAKAIGIKTFAILGYSGGKCLGLADVSIHFPVNDMQIAEDMQLIVGHMVMQWLKNHEGVK